VKKITTKKFDLPKKLMNDLYEATGAGDRYKGFIMVVCNEEGDPMVCFDSEASVVHLGLLKGMEKYLTEQEL
jgi:hypothetical protein